MKLANDDEFRVKLACTVVRLETNLGVDIQLLRANLKISDCSYVCFGDFCEITSFFQVKIHNNSMVANKGPIVLLKSSRSVKLIVTYFQHRL